MHPLRWIPLLVCGALLHAAAGTAAPVIDGTLDAEYGAALATQTTQTEKDALGDYDMAEANGSELDQAYAFVSDGVLHLFLSGNLLGYFAMEWYPQDYLHIFVDSKPGGQSVLRGDNSGVGFWPNALNLLAGLTFDTGFAPDYWFDCTVFSWEPHVFAYAAELLDAGGGAGWCLGASTAGGPGTLTGGTNPYGVQMTLDNRNHAGVTYGCGAASGEGVTTGIEWAIPLAAIGDPAGCFTVCAFVTSASSTPPVVWNQVLGPVPPGTCYLGLPADVDFANIAGEQFFTVCPSSVPVRTSTWGSVKTLYR
jgi:hypothetical protein